MEYIELYILNQPCIYLCPFYSMHVIMYIDTTMILGQFVSFYESPFEYVWITVTAGSWSRT